MIFKSLTCWMWCVQDETPVAVDKLSVCHMQVSEELMIVCFILSLPFLSAVDQDV